jgi:copper chaperone CopZ
MAESTPLQFDVPDIDCESCVRSISEALRRIDPQAEVLADLRTKRVTIGSQMDAGQAAEAIETAGFAPKAAG